MSLLKFYVLQSFFSCLLTGFPLLVYFCIDHCCNSSVFAGGGSMCSRERFSLRPLSQMMWQLETNRSVLGHFLPARQQAAGSQVGKQCWMTASESFTAMPFFFFYLRISLLLVFIHVTQLILSSDPDVATDLRLFTVYCCPSASQTVLFNISLDKSSQSLFYVIIYLFVCLIANIAFAKVKFIVFHICVFSFLVGHLKYLLASKSPYVLIYFEL